MTSAEIAEWLSQRIAEIDDEAEGHRAALADLDTERRGLQLSLSRVAARRDSEAGKPVAEVLPTGAEAPRESEDSGGDGSPDDDADVLATGAAASPDDWSGMGNTEAVQKVLATATDLMSPGDILAKLKSNGYAIADAHPIRGALAYLKRKEKADFARRGAWYLIGSPAHKVYLEGDIFANVSSEAAEDADTPTADAAGVSGGDEPQRQEGGRIPALTG